MGKILTEAELAEGLGRLPGWRVETGRLVRDWRFASFAEAMTFVNRVAELAEELDHHPDVDVRYDKVRLALISHDLGGLTRRDVRFAERMVDW